MHPLDHDASDEELINAITDNYIRSWNKITAFFQKPDPQDLFGIEGFLSGIPYMMMNSLFDGPADLSSDKASEVLQYYIDNHYPLMWFVTPKGINRGIDSILESLGVELATMQVPGMALDLQTCRPKELEEVATMHNIAETSQAIDNQGYTQIFMKAFEVDPTIKDPMEQFSKEFVKHPTSTHFVATLEDEPAAAASVVYDAGVAGIYNVATLPQFRGKGLAKALMASCHRDAIEKGFRYSILHSTTMGHPLYEKLGYKDYFTFKRYLLRPTDVGLP